MYPKKYITIKVIFIYMHELA